MYIYLSSQPDIYVVATVFIISVSTPHAGMACPNGYSAPAGSRSCYKLSASQANEDDAKAACNAEGAHLVDIETITELRILADFVQELGGKSFSSELLFY